MSKAKPASHVGPLMKVISGLVLLIILISPAGFAITNPAYGQYNYGTGSANTTTGASSDSSNTHVSASIASNTSASSTNKTSAATGTLHFLKGQVSNVQLDNGQPAWIESGWWVMRASSDQNSGNITNLSFVSRFDMIKPDGTAMHMHWIYNFTLSNFSTEGNSTDVFKGVATVLLKGKTIPQVPITIKISNMKVLAMWIGPEKVDNHFGTNPIYGTAIHSSQGQTMMSSHAMSSSMSAPRTQNLTNTSIPIKIPLTKGLYDGKDVFFTTTEASDSKLASILSKQANFNVTFAPALSKSPPESLGTIFVFENGVNGTGAMGFQSDVFDSIPGDPDYTPLWKVSMVQWNTNNTAGNDTQPSILGSDDDIAAAASKGQVTVTPTDIVRNCPIIQWGGNSDGSIPAGHMKIRDNTTLTDTTPYGGGQLLSIDTNNSQATFVGHRGFGPNGSTVYYIVTDASMKGPADMLGVIYTNRTANLNASGASDDLYHFSNGIAGTGPVGFQAGIVSALPSSSNYTPMWRIQLISWNNPANATMLTSTKDISAHTSEITISYAGVVVNCPIIKSG
jgi:hypothetical protein